MLVLEIQTVAGFYKTIEHRGDFLFVCLYLKIYICKSLLILLDHNTYYWIVHFPHYSLNEWPWHFFPECLLLLFIFIAVSECVKLLQICGKDSDNQWWRPVIREQTEKCYVSWVVLLIFASLSLHLQTSKQKHIKDKLQCSQQTVQLVFYS